jgi:hypothetical protein
MSLTLTYQTASVREKLQLCGALLKNEEPKSATKEDPPLTACELARIKLAEAIITEALACGSGPSTGA